MLYFLLRSPHIASPWKSQPRKRVAKVTKWQKGQLQETAQNKKKQKSVSKHYRSEHGHNPTHSTVDCWMLQNWAKATNQVQKDKQNFSNKNLHNEINVLVKTSSKKKIMDMYASVIRQEQAKLDSKKKPDKLRKIIAL